MLASHHQASKTFHLNQQLLGGEAMGIQFHLEAILRVGVVPHSCHILREPLHRASGLLVLFNKEGHAGTSGGRLAPLGAATDPAASE